MTKFNKKYASIFFETSSTIFSMYELPIVGCGSFQNDHDHHEPMTMGPNLRPTRGFQNARTSP
jgi:hypothetical protein